MIREARCQGSVTVFFALTLTLILAVICTTLESARYSLLSYFASQAQGAAVESVFCGLLQAALGKLSSAFYGGQRRS